MKDMQETLKVIRKADKDFKVSLAGTYHKELLDDLNDYCITIAEKFTPEEIEARRKAGKVTTYYTCCTEPRRDTFTFSEPAEAEWLAWHSAKRKSGRISSLGFKQLGEKSPTRQPFHSLGCRRHVYDLSGRPFIYPVGTPDRRNTIFEKVRILKEEFEEKGNKGAIKNEQNLENV